MAEERMLKRATAYSVLLMFFVFLFSASFQDKPNNISFASQKVEVTPSTGEVTLAPMYGNVNQDASSEAMGVWANIAGNDHTKLAKQLGTKFIIIEKPKGLSEITKISLEDLSVDRSIVITINGLKENIREDGIGRVTDDNYFYGIPLSPTPTPTSTPSPTVVTALYSSSQEDMIKQEVDIIHKQDINSTLEDDSEVGLVGNVIEDEESLDELIINNEDPVKSLKLAYTDVLEDDTYSAKLTFTLDTTYAYKIYEDDYNYYISLMRPKDVYERIIVVDAGHGGIDSGTYSKGNDYLEKDMNLSMLLYLKEYLDKEDIKVYYTRTTDRKLTLSQRVDLANAVEADFFLSIHCNANNSSKVNGIEVLYNDKQNSWDKFNSKQFSKICLEEVNALIGLKNRGLVPRSHNVTIIGESNVPVALIEVAYMSNRDDLNFLKEEENRKAAAIGMYHAILRAYDELNEDENVTYVKMNEEKKD